MSERKRLRMGRCIKCLEKKYLVQHGKCSDCRVGLQMSRYAKKGKLDKFRSKGKQQQP